MHTRHVINHQIRVAKIVVWTLILGGLVLAAVCASPMLGGATFHEVASGQRGFWLAIGIGCFFAGVVSARKV